jgi:hypothetical protein
MVMLAIRMKLIVNNAQFNDPVNLDPRLAIFA